MIKNLKKAVYLVPPSGPVCTAYMDDMSLPISFALLANMVKTSKRKMLRAEEVLPKVSQLQAPIMEMQPCVCI